jgi:hypothetical protein
MPPTEEPTVESLEPALIILHDGDILAVPVPATWNADHLKMFVDMSAAYITKAMSKRVTILPVIGGTQITVLRPDGAKS